GDADAADATLRAIARQRAIVYAALERPDGAVVSEQGLGLRLTEDIDLDAEGDISLFALVFTRTVRVAVPVVSNAREIGRIVLVAETGDLAERIAGVALNAALAGLLAIGVGLVVALRLHRAVTQPLASLARTMDAVRLRHDYTQRAAITADDEVGTLAGTFNDLLGAVNERDRKLAEHGAHLEEEVRIRTCDLSEAMLAAEAANTAKSSFLATMSHEIRTPMNGMLVMAELLAGADLPPRQRRYAEVIARSGQSLLAIINDILDFAKVEAGKLDLERVAVSPAEIADTVVTLFGERARSAGLDLAAYVAADVPRTILGDPVRLGQVVSNFVSNALKFTEAGHVLVRIEPCPEDDRFLLIRVSDTGIGIPQDKLGSIFSAFSQADQSTTRRFGGTGLGLSIAQRLIEAMGGTVGVESRIGIGSTFWARIPMESEAASLPVLRADAVAPGVVLGALGGATREAL
ncbi:ATP-binding protein, partial [Methylobacterium trifolii]